MGHISGGQLSGKYRYTPFGVPMSGGKLSPNTKLLNNPYGYNGEYHDLESGFQYLRARYYNPETARFITRDSYLGDINEPLTLNRYAYTSNNPVMNIDPSGHKEVQAFDESDGVSSTANSRSNKSTNVKAILERNSKYNDKVKQLQTMLDTLGYDIGDAGADGYFGEDTESAVDAYKKASGKSQDGKVDPGTWEDIKKKYNNVLSTGLTGGIASTPNNNKGKSNTTSSGYAEKKAEQRNSYNDKGCGDGSEETPSMSEIYSNMVSKEKGTLTIDGISYGVDKINIGNADIEARLNNSLDNARASGNKFDELEVGVKIKFYKDLKWLKTKEYEYIRDVVPAYLSLEDGEMAVSIIEAELGGAVLNSGLKAFSYVKGSVAIKGATQAEGNLRFTQTTASPYFSAEGKFAGKTIGEVSDMLRTGKLKVSDVPVTYIERDGVKLIENTRSSLALKRANIPESEWNLINKTGDLTIEAKITERLKYNKLTNSGTDVLRITGEGKNASSLK